MEDKREIFAGRKYGTRELIEAGVITGELAQSMLDDLANPLPPISMTVTSVDHANGVITFDSTPVKSTARRMS